MKNFLLIFIMLWILLKCSHHHHHGDANEHMNQTSFEDLTSSFENPERDKWQKPKEVLAFLEKESSKKSLKGLSVADLGAGTGYFSIRLLDAGAKVIALDADERFLNYIQKKAESNPRKTSLSLRKIPYTSAELKKEEVDILLSVNVYHHIENRVSYFSEIKKSLKKDGFICIIDFKEGKLPVHSPPESMRISKEQTIDELQKAGFKVSVEEKTLDYQYIYVAK